MRRRGRFWKEKLASAKLALFLVLFSGSAHSLVAIRQGPQAVRRQCLRCSSSEAHVPKRRALKAAEAAGRRAGFGRRRRHSTGEAAANAAARAAGPGDLPPLTPGDLPDETLYLLDGTAMMFRAFYGRGAGGYLAADGATEVGAVRAMGVELARFVTDVRPRYLAMAFDVGRDSTFRRAIFADYKAQRAAHPQGLLMQMPLAKAMVTALGCRYFELEGYEADDVMATLSRWGRAAGLNIAVVSDDKDMCQLAADRVHIVTPGRPVRLSGGGSVPGGGVNGCCKGSSNGVNRTKGAGMNGSGVLNGGSVLNGRSVLNDGVTSGDEVLYFGDVLNCNDGGFSSSNGDDDDNDESSSGTFYYRIRGEADVAAEYGGVAPGRLPELIALAGDAADNIPGVRGVGVKGASALLRRFGSLEALFAALPAGAVAALPGLRGAVGLQRRLALPGVREAALLYRRIATLDEEAPLPGLDALRSSDLRFRGAAPEAAGVLGALGFRGPLEVMRRGVAGGAIDRSL